MKRKNIATLFYSTAGVAAMFVVLIAFYFVTSQCKARVDLTAEKAYTLSAGTRHILAKLTSPVTLHYYCSQAEMPPEFKPYAQEIEDLLGEYQQAGKGKIKLEKLDPKPDSDAEDSARLNGIQGESLNGMGGDNIYLGLAVSQLDEKVTIPSWLDMLQNPGRERMLEYEISRAISRVVNPEPPSIGVMSALPLFGEEGNPMMRMTRQSEEPYVFISELKKDYTLVEVPMTASQIDDKIKALIIDQPRGITDSAEYAIDQFIMRGGKVIAFLDPSALFDPQHDQMEQILQRPSNGQSSLPKLLKAWGLEMDLTKVVADANDLWRDPRTGSPMPAVLMLTRKGINQDDIVTSQLDNLCLPFAGAFTGKPADGLTETVLARSSTNAELMESIVAGMNGAEILKDFKPTGLSYDIAVRLTGKFKTAFPEGKPAAQATPPNPDEPPPAPKPAETDTNQLKESVTNSVVILVADSDCLYDSVAFSVGNFGGYRVAQPNNGNINLLLNAVDQLASDNDLIAVRSRGGLNRPFTRLQELKEKAGRQEEDKRAQLETLAKDTQQKIEALQASKPGGITKFIPSPEQQAELKKLEDAAADYRKQLHQVEKNLAKDTDSLESTIRILNIGAMPALVALSGIVLSLVKRKRTAAK